MLQPLEMRQLLSVSATFDDGVIEVMGTKAADQITVSTGPTGGWSIKSGDEFVPVDTGNDQVIGIMVLGGGRDDVIDVYLDANDIDVTVCGHSGNDKVTAGIYASARVEVHGGLGNDVIDVQNNTVAKAGVVDGMWGDDAISVSNSYGGRGLRVYGGSGNDTIRATGQLHGSGGHAVWGGTGDDVIVLANVDIAQPVTHVARGEAGNDSITGSDGRDVLFGDDGADVLRGGAGDDLLFGGTGNDRLYGHEGDDFLDGGPGRDSVNGDDGEDMALEDKLDAYTNVETLI